MKVKGKEIESVTSGGNAQAVATPQSIYELVALINKGLVEGNYSPSIKEYQAYAREIKSNNDPIVGYLLEGNIFTCFPTEDDKVIDSRFYWLPVQVNIHVNSLAKKQFKISMSEARAYKLATEEIFLSSKDIYESLLEKCKNGELPNKTSNFEIELESFTWKEHGQKVEKKTRRKTTKLTTEGSPSISPTKKAKEKNISLKRVQMKNAKKIALDVIEEDLYTVEPEISPLNIYNASKVTISSADGGKGFFPLVFMDSKGLSHDFALEYFAMEELLKIFLHKDTAEMSEDDYKLLIKIVLRHEFQGCKIQEMKEKEKNSLIYNKSNYQVYS